MDCNQKSGVFLNISCNNEITGICENCIKSVCTTHLHSLDSKNLCEDCYWEAFIYTKEKQPDRDYIEDRDSSYTFVSSSSSKGETGFAGGFGGGAFGGGGASGTWTENDAAGFTETDGAAGAGLLADDADGTFFYS